MQPKTKRQPARVTTTVGDLAAAFYEAALSELKNPQLAARVAEQLLHVALGRQQLAHT
jgi:hypothetical protein